MTIRHDKSVTRTLHIAGEDVINHMSAARVQIIYNNLISDVNKVTLKENFHKCKMTT